MHGSYLQARSVKEVSTKKEVLIVVGNRWNVWWCIIDSCEKEPFAGSVGRVLFVIGGYVPCFLS